MTVCMCRGKIMGCMLFQDGVQLQDLPAWFQHAAVAGPAGPAAPADLARLRLQPARRLQLTALTPTGPQAPISRYIGRPGGALAQEAAISPLLDGCRRQHMSVPAQRGPA